MTPTLQLPPPSAGHSQPERHPDTPAAPPATAGPHPIKRCDVLLAGSWALCGVLLGFLIAFPKDFHPDVSRCVHGRLCESYLPLCEDPWHTETPEYPQTRHRILAPVIAHYLGLRGYGAALLPWLTNVPLLAVVYLGIHRRLGRRPAVLATLLTATTLSVLTSATWPGYPDSLAVLALVLCMFVPRTWFGALCLFLGGFADERIFAVVPFLLLWHGLEDTDRVLRRTVIRLALYGAAAAAWFVCTRALQRYWGIDDHEAYVAAYNPGHDHPREIVMGLYAAFRACWLFPLFMPGRWTLRQNPLRPLTLALFVPIMAAALHVGDISRVVSFALPAVLLGYVQVYRHDAREGLYLSLAALVINIVSPVYQIHPPFIDHLPSSFDMALGWLFGKPGQ
jgi:hypothetical protein